MHGDLWCADQQHIQIQQILVSRAPRKSENLEHFKWTCYDIFNIFVRFGGVTDNKDSRIKRCYNPVTRTVIGLF